MNEIVKFGHILTDEERAAEEAKAEKPEGEQKAVEQEEADTIQANEESVSSGQETEPGISHQKPVDVCG